MNYVHGCAWRQILSRLFMMSAVLLIGPQAHTATILVYGTDVPARIQARITELVAKTGATRVAADDASAVDGDWVLAFGSNPVVQRSIAASELAERGPEGFIVRSFQLNGVTTLVANGNPSTRDRVKVNRGVEYAAYEVLQQVGFRFNHPMEPKSPRALSLASVVDVRETPRWPDRGLHLHTQHQLELTHVLNGWGYTGPSDVAGFEALLKDWDLFCEWMIAHRQNMVEWVLLASKETPAFNDSLERQARLKRIVAMSHAWGLATGIDVGIVFEQQNAWRLLRSNGKNSAQDDAEISSRVAWLAKTDIDFIDVEAGFQEFRAPDDQRSLEWLNTIVRESAKFGMKAQVKIHCASDMKAKHFVDPDTHQPMNFNFVPHFADSRLTVLPHTVQNYGLDDPAPTYGNETFSEVRRFMSMEAGTRDVLYYPEAAYWVSFDIDVPMFLASYGERRAHDLRLIAQDEDAGRMGRGTKAGSHIQGQMLFSSGFEWGYWLNNLAAMHAAWNPHVEASDDNAAYAAVLKDSLRDDSPVIPVLVDQAAAEKELLIEGKINGTKPKSIYKRSGMAYLAGQETWDELNTFIADKFKKDGVLTQASRAGFIFRSKLVVNGIDYPKEIAPLLAAMSSKFGVLATRFEALTGQSEELTELAQASRMMALRSEQIVALYKAHAYKPLKQSKSWRDARAAEARKAVDRAKAIVALREPHYRVDRRLISEWGHTPTSYRYGYLWTAHSLHWWYRDEGSALKVSRRNFCFMNIVNPADNVFAKGQQTFVYKVLKAISIFPLLGALHECLSPSKNEPDPRQRVRGKELMSVASASDDRGTDRMTPLRED